MYIFISVHEKSGKTYFFLKIQFRYHIIQLKIKFIKCKGLIVFIKMPVDANEHLISFNPENFLSLIFGSVTHLGTTFFVDTNRMSVLLLFAKVQVGFFY